MEERRL